MATTHFNGPVDSKNGFLTNGLAAAPSLLSKQVSATAATLTVDPTLHVGKLITLNRAAGVTVTLPAATGSGNVYTFYVGTTVTSNNDIIKVANSSDSFVGQVDICTTTFGAESAEAAGGTDDTLTMNGTTSGGIIGSFASFTDMSATLWYINCRLVGSGTLIGSLSATV